MARRTRPGDRTAAQRARGHGAIVTVLLAACASDRTLPIEPICGEASARRMLGLQADGEVERIVVDRDRGEVLFGVVAPVNGAVPRRESRWPCG